MRIGDLVRIKDTDSDIDRIGESGIVLRFDFHHPDSSSTMIQIVEVLWPKGKGWIDKERLNTIYDKV
tara:strand:- start:203 stop:403 length:201 start_codon:yes stop_codon:yes gene_type:complete